MAEQQDIPQMKQLWQVCFGDSQEYIDFFYEYGYPTGQTLVCAENSRVVSMLTLFPAQLKTKEMTANGVYVYAVATDPEYRGQGLMKQLEQYAESLMRKQGKDFMTLVPASESLFSLYEQCGYHTFGVRAHLEYQVNLQSEKKPVTPLSVEEYIKLRNDWSTKQTAILDLCGLSADYRTKELLFAKWSAVLIESTMVLYRVTDENTLYVRELLGSADVLDMLCQYTKKQRAVVVLNPLNTDFETKNYTMLKALTNKKYPMAYANLLLD